MMLQLRWASATLAAVASGALYLPAATDPLVDLKTGIAAYESKRYPAAIATLEPLAARLPLLADYSAWFLGSAQFEAKDYAKVPRTLDAVLTHKPSSPLATRAVLLSSTALIETGQAAQAVVLLRKHYATLPQPQADLALATALSASGDDTNAAAYHQRVYYGFPASPEAATSETEIARLRALLGEAFPPVMGRTMLDRALKLMAASQSARALRELQALAPQLTGADHDLALVRMGVAQYPAAQAAAAYRYFSALEVTSEDANAERLYRLLQASRRLKRAEDTQFLDALAQYPNSTWRMQALIDVAYSFLILNQPDSYEPLYRACYENFPKDPQGAFCHWKATWSHYIRRKPDAGEMLRAHVRLFPASDDTSAALYFLGRLAEDSADAGSASTYYEEIAREYPNLYYGLLSRDRLEKVRSNAPSAPAAQFLKGVAFPLRSRTREFQPGAAIKVRMERVRMLMAAGLDTWAEGELRHAAQTEDQPHIAATELASLIAADRPGQALRYIKRYFSGYTYIPVESAPLAFWRQAFPFPYRSDVNRLAQRYDVDPFIAAGLIRQESEFDAKAVSKSNARGLMQVMPATGKELSGRLKLAGFSTPRLFDPAFNLELGTYYFKMLTGLTGGKTEVTLAAYNAGLTRARNWITWAEFREPAEFVETIPFAETRGYVQAVLRNADLYRRVYGPSMQASVPR